MNRKLNIVYTATQYNQVVSGPGRFAEYLKQLRSDKLSIYFISDQIAQAGDREIAAARINWLYKMPFYWILRAWFFARALQILRKKVALDAILCSSPFEAIFFSNMQIPVYVMVNDYNYALPDFQNLRKTASLNKAVARQVYHYLEKWVVRRSDFMVANSLFNQKIIEKAYQLPVSKSKLLYKVVDLSYFQFSEKEPKPPRQFLFIKNDFRRGGLPVIIKALSKLEFSSQISLVVAGLFPSAIIEVQEMAHQAGFKGKLLVEGLVKRDKIVALLRASDVFINMAYQEALGVSCLEAMACGAPVIASNAGGLPEVLDNGKAGFLLEPGDETGLAQLINQLWQQPELMQEKSRHALQHVQKFSLSNLEQNLFDLFTVEKKGV